jgi:ferritin-like metal-binding protein YciE
MWRITKRVRWLLPRVKLRHSANLEQTKQHAQRLEQILSSHKQTTRGGPNARGWEGVVAEGAEMIEEEADVEVKDAGLIAAAQRVEHYEMPGYGTARNLCRTSR